jgi:hypothetical protein
VNNIAPESNYNLLPISNISDKDKPLSFQVWKNRFEIIIPEQAYAQYNDYLINWYKNKENTKNDLTLQTKVNFLNLLKQIQVFFTDEEKENWYSGINIDNEKEVLLAIPYFARKLKNISLYYLQLREQIKRSKIKYNLAGSNKSIVKQIQDIILQNYTKKGDGVITLPSTLWSHIPSLSSIQNSFTIEIEELYDTASYFDRSSTLPPSAYFPIEQETEKYFLTKGIDLSSIDWVYRLGTFTLSSLNDTSQQGTTSPESTGLYLDLAQKYLGRNLYSSFIVQSSAKKDFYNINIIPGNNFFYYPGSPYKINVTGLPRYVPTPLSATALQTLGTAGSSIENADTIFLKTKKGIEGAWFRKKVLDTGEKTMKATIEGGTSTIFRFPYPGYGISAEDIKWTGYGLETDPRYFYLDDTTKRGIEQIYWNTSFSLSGTVPISINETSLIFNGAYSNNNFNNADKIRVWPTPPLYSDLSYANTVDEAWLYKFTQTNISIGTNSNNTILWPYYKLIDPAQLDELPYTPNSICLPETISDLTLPFAVASNYLSSADVIYKIKNVYEGPSQAIECAWLSATSIFQYPEDNTYGSKSDNFNILLNPGIFTHFIWDYSTTDINDIFNLPTTHAADCKYITTPNTTYNDHELCTCKFVNFAPLGHPGENYYDYNGLCDIIVEDSNTIPLTAIDIGSWRDQNGSDFANSSAAGWYKTSKNIGWGHGTWYSGAQSTGNRFYLKKGKRYIYYRANTKNKNLNDNSFPPLAIRQNNINKTPGVWMGAKLNINEWVSTDTRSEMVINPNDLIIYSRTGSTTYNITGSYVAEQTIAENRGSIWCNFDYITVNHPSTFVTVSFPIIYSQGNLITQTGNAISISNVYDQLPKIPPGSFQRILNWKITTPTGSIGEFPDQQSVTFRPILTGLFTIELTGLSAANGQTGCFYFSAIPQLTALPDTTIIPTVSTFYTPVPGFVLTTDLRGWNYSNNTQSNIKDSNSGAKPLWVKSYINKTVSTNYKSVESWAPARVFFDTFNAVPFYEPSNILLKGGEYIEYKRTPQTQIVWNQNITLNNAVNINEWCKLEFSSTTTPTVFNPKNTLITKPTTTPSSILLENFIENEPVEVHYNAINSFVWPITAEPQISETIFSTLISSTAITSNYPWSNLTNQFYPTVATFPTLDSLHSSKQLSYYFTPQNLGLLTYVDKDYTFDLTLSSINLANLYGSPSQKINNRGLTREQQQTPYSLIKDNNIWLKEPYTTGSLAGTIKKSVFKKYQKFIPYQSSYESNPTIRLGLTTPVSRQHPWGGFQDTKWADSTNQPISFTGQINVSRWVKDQVLKNTTLQLDKWCSDIYGNQYGLYKNIKNTTPKERLLIPGQIWLRKNSQQTEPSEIALLDVFDTYKNLSIYSELTGTGIYNIDVFYDTLFIETSSALIFEKINYDYSQARLFSIADLSRSISLTLPVQTNLNREITNTLPVNQTFAKVGDTWFFAKDKKIIISLIELQNYNVTASLYSLNLNTNILKQEFYLSSITPTFSSFNIIEVSKPALSYNSSKKQFLYSFIGKDTENKNTIISLYINNFLQFEVDKIKIYTSQTQPSLPPTLLSNLNITLPISSTYFEQLITSSSNSIFEPINFPTWAMLSEDGRFNVILAPEVPQTYNLPFKVTNDAGPVYASLNITIT